MILFIIPQYKSAGHYYELPVGMCYIIAYLKKKYEVDVFNFNEEILTDDFQTRFTNKVLSADVVAIGGLSIHYNIIKEIIDNVRRIKNVKIIVGGGIISSEPELMVENLGIDHGVIGEGEYAVEKILSGEITDKIVNNIEINNLDELPFPDFDAIGVSAYLDRQMCGDEHYTYPVNNPRVLPILTSRSCPFNCTFCFHPCGKKYRQRGIDNICSEIEDRMSRYNVNIVILLDELIANNLARLEKICKEIKKYNLKWMTQIRVTQVNNDAVKMMKEAGCFQLSLGIEHIDENVLKSMKKHITKKQIETALKTCYNHGLGIQGNILFGDIAETSESIKIATNWWKQNKKYGVNLTNVIPFPGSELFKKHCEAGRITNKLSYIQKGCPSIMQNIPEYSLIDDCRKTNKMFGKLISSKKVLIDKYRGAIYNVKVKCYHCKSENIYNGLYHGATGSCFVGEGIYRIACRKCNQRFDFYLDYRNVFLLKSKKVINSLLNKLRTLKKKLSFSIKNFSKHFKIR